MTRLLRTHRNDRQALSRAWVKSNKRLANRRARRNGNALIREAT